MTFGGGRVTLLDEMWKTTLAVSFFKLSLGSRLSNELIGENRGNPLYESHVSR